MTTHKQLHLNTLNTGERVTMIAGKEPEAFKYVFTVEEPGEMPHGEITQTNPDGSTVGPAKAVLQGTGNWTTPEQNPMQRADWFIGRAQQERAMTIGYGVLHVGGLIIVSEPGDYSSNRLHLEPACTDIILDEPTTE